MRYWFVLHKQNRKEVFADDDLLRLRNKKHNYKTSPYFEDAYISPIFDNTRPIPHMPMGIMGDLLAPRKGRRPI